MHLVLALTLGTVALGCGASAVEIEGKLMNGSNVYTIGENESITLTFTGEDGKTGSANVEKDGSFVVRAPAGKPLTAGKYKISLVHYQMPKTNAKDGSSPTPTTKNNPDMVEIGGTNKSLTVDFAKFK
jgi:hypothetical protein